jgi:hypothetical protein
MVISKRADRDNGRQSLWFLIFFQNKVRFYLVNIFEEFRTSIPTEPNFAF